MCQLQFLYHYAAHWQTGSPFVNVPFTLVHYSRFRRLIFFIAFAILLFPLFLTLNMCARQGGGGDVLTLLGGADPATDFGFLTAAAPRQRDA